MLREIVGCLTVYSWYLFSSWISLAAIKGDADMQRVGIIKRIIWQMCVPTKYWLPIGQSSNIKPRVAKLHDSFYRSQHPSLHYRFCDPEP